MPRLLYEYIYVNMWILLFLALSWANDGLISFTEGVILIVISVAGLAVTGKKQLPQEGRYRPEKL